MDHLRGYGAWQWLFIIEGVATVAIAFSAYFILPNFPRTTSWLSEEERALAIWRLEEDIGQDDWVNAEEQTFWHGAAMAFADSKTYVLVSSPHFYLVQLVACCLRELTRNSWFSSSAS